jgi:hypothetical protein
MGFIDERNMKNYMDILHDRYEDLLSDYKKEKEEKQEKELHKGPITRAAEAIKKSTEII